MTDNDIIRGIRENSESAWRAFFAKTHDQFKPKISALLKRASETTYEDIYEQSCLDLMDNVKDGKLVESEDVNLSGYMYTICWRLALKAETKRKRAEGRMEEYLPEEEVQLEYDPADQDTAENEAMAFLNKVLESMPIQCRQIFRRFYWDKMPMKDIAAAMGLKNDDVAKATKSKCMKKFKDIARAMLVDDEKAEEAVRRTVERDALRDLLEECRNEASGDWSIAAMSSEDETDN